MMNSHEFRMQLLSVYQKEINNCPTIEEDTPANWPEFLKLKYPDLLDAYMYLLVHEPLESRFLNDQDFLGLVRRVRLKDRRFLVELLGHIRDAVRLEDDFQKLEDLSLKKDILISMHRFLKNVYFI